MLEWAGGSRRAFVKRAAAAGAAAWMLGAGAHGETRARAQEGGGGGRSGDQPLAPPDKQPPDLKVPERPQRRAKWALAGLGQLTLEELLPALRRCERTELVALVTGHPEKGRRVAESQGLDPGRVYGYDQIERARAEAGAEVLYVVTPNSLHAAHTVAGLRGGMHVLCEKPMAASVEECERMISAAREAERALAIAYRLRYEPFNMKVIEMCRGRALGQLRSFLATNAQDVKAPNIRLSRELAGGPVEDVGVYCINAARYVTGEEPVEVTAMEHRPGGDSRFREVPARVAFTLRFPSGVLAHCGCGFDLAESRWYRVECEEGFIELDNAFAYQGQRLRVRRSDEKAKEREGPKGANSGGDSGARSEELAIEPVNHFAAEMDEFSRCVLEGERPRTPGEDGLADMRVIAAVAEAARSGRAVRIG